MTEGQPSSWRGFARISTALGVGAIAAIASYDHIRDLAITHGQSVFIGNLMPLSVDGLIVCSTFALDSENKVWPRVGFSTGVAATVAANILAAPPNVLARVISAWAPVALLLVVEILSRRRKATAWWKRRPAVVVPAVDDGLTVTNHRVEAKESTQPPLPKVAPATARKIAKAAANKPSAKTTEIAAKTGYSETTVRRALALEAAKTDDPDAELAELTKVSVGVVPAAE